MAVQSSEFYYEIIQNSTLKLYGGGNFNSVVSHTHSIGFYITWGNLLQNVPKAIKCYFKDSADKGNDANMG